MQIALDFDDTIYNWCAAFGVDPAVRQYGTLPTDYEARYERCSTLEAHHRAGLLPGAKEALWFLHHHGVKVHVMTLRRPEARDVTMRFLAEEEIPFDSFELRKPFDKVSRCLERDIPIIVDDKPGTILDAAVRGVIPATIEWPWNVDAARRARAISAPSWDHLAPKLLDVLRRVTPA